MSFIERGSTLARATKRYLDAHASLKWHYAPTAIGLLAAVALVVTRYPAKTVFVRSAEATTAITGEVSATSIVVGIAAVLALGLAATVTAMAVVSGLCTASISGAVAAIHDPDPSTNAEPTTDATADSTAELTTEATMLRGALTGLWRAKRALPVLALLLGTLGPLVVVADRRWETLRRERGGLGQLLGASPGTYAHLAIPVAANEGGSARHALRRSRHLLTDRYGDDALATPGIVPVVGSTWLLPPLLLGILPLFYALATGQDPNVLYDDVIWYVATPLLALGTIGIVRAIVIQSAFRATLYHHLTTDPDQKTSIPTLETVQPTIDASYTPHNTQPQHPTDTPPDDD